MLPIRQLVNQVRRLSPCATRLLSTKPPIVDVAVDDDGIAIVTMQRLPVNSLNLDLLQALGSALDKLAKEDCQGMILTSGSPTVFSAGLDIMEMYKPDMKRAEAFWTTLQDVWIKLFGSTFPTAAAINGHAPAGGCLLSMSCEYRTMVAGKFTIGLNETALGIVAPNWFMDTMTHTIPIRQAELALTTGKLFTVDEALKVGLIDEVAADKNDAIEKSKKFFQKFNGISPMARAFTKQKIRQRPIANLVKNRKVDIDEFLMYLKNPQVQQGLEMYIHMLKQKASKGK